jgi:uncharacterized protein YndB with AHSA1/START domain
MKEYNWLQFTRRVPLNADRNTIFRAWATTQGLESWFLKKAVFKGHGKIRVQDELICPGDEYEWNWHGYPDTAKECHRILEVNSPKGLQFRFSGNSIVNVQIKEEEGGWLCELAQSMEHTIEQQRTQFYIECALGWTFYLANLKSVLEGGLDLRNRNVGLVQVINA